MDDLNADTEFELVSLWQSHAYLLEPHEIGAH